MDKLSEIWNKTIGVIFEAKLSNWFYLSEQQKKTLKVMGKNKYLTNSQSGCADATGNQLFYLSRVWNILLSGCRCKSNKTTEDSQNIFDSPCKSKLEILLLKILL